MHPGGRVSRSRLQRDPRAALAGQCFVFSGREQLGRRRTETPHEIYVLNPHLLEAGNLDAFERPCNSTYGRFLKFAFSGDSQFIAALPNNDQAILLFDVSTGKLLCRIATDGLPRSPTNSDPAGWLLYLVFTPICKTLATISDEGSVYLWDAKAGRRGILPPFGSAICRHCPKEPITAFRQYFLRIQKPS